MKANAMQSLLKVAFRKFVTPNCSAPYFTPLANQQVTETKPKLLAVCV